MRKEDPTIGDVLEAIGVFSNAVDGRFDRLEGRMEKLEGRMENVEGKMDGLERHMSGLESSVKNYLELSDKRYLELRQTNRIIFKYLKMVVEKTETPIDLKELEEMVN